MNTALLPDNELLLHSFEIVKLYKYGEEWRAQFAIDNVLYPEFLEPHHNVAELSSDDFLRYMKGQALTMASYWQSKGQA